MMDPVASQDQQEAAARQTAETAKALVVALMTVGFSREEAMWMVTYWIGEQWGG